MWLSAFTRSTVEDCMICWTRGQSLRFERIRIKISMWLVCRKNWSAAQMSSWMSSSTVATSELPHKMRQTHSRHARMPFCRSLLSIRRRYSPRYRLSIWRAMKEELITSTRTNRQKLMEQRSTSHCCHSKNASGPLIKEKVTLLSVEVSSQWSSKTPSSASATQWWSATSRPTPPPPKTQWTRLGNSSIT